MVANSEAMTEQTNKITHKILNFEITLYYSWLQVYNTVSFVCSVIQRQLRNKDKSLFNL